MTKPKKRRPDVSPVERLRWLEELERGIGITAIARAAGRDIRVVKRHIEISRQDRELGLARREFIRGRLEQHQEDLLAEVGRLRQPPGQSRLLAVRPDDPLKRKIHEALTEHVRRLPLSRLLGAYQDAARQYEEARAQVREDLGRKETDLLSSLSTDVDLYPWTEHLAQAVEAPAWEDHPWEKEYRENAVGEKNGYDLTWGEFHLARSPVPKLLLSSLKKAHMELVTAAKERIPALRPHASRLKDLRAQIVEELDVLVLRRLVPGRCKYCPV